MSTPTEEPKKPESGGTSHREEVVVKGQLGRLISDLWAIITLAPRLIWRLLMLIADLTATTDAEGTIKSIKDGIQVKGYNMWILMASAVIASIGLDQDSGAVIIGAMLISPLMSPILGIGLGVGIYDRDTLRDSLKNFAIAMGISLFASTLYFLITPLGELTPQMEARTQPNLLDVGVAFFGGVAGIVAGSRKEKTNAIPGVAIATALMPPLCTAGYGIAHFNLGVFAGASYLFFLNSVFISLSTFLIVRFLKFPLKGSLDSSVMKRVFSVVGVFVVLICLPAGYLLFNLVKEHSQRRAIETYVNETLGQYPGVKVMNWDYQQQDSLNEVLVTLAGDYIPQPDIDSLSGTLPKYDLKACTLRVIQTNLDPDKLDEYGSEMQKHQRVMDLIQEQVQTQQRTLDSVLVLIKDQPEPVPMARLEEELQPLFPELKSFAFATFPKIDYENGNDTLPTALIRWDPKLSRRSRSELEKRLKGYLITHMNLDTCVIIRY